MKLGISYNLFSGEEFLPHATKELRDICDHICVVYQDISYASTPIPKTTLDLLEDLKKQKLIDSYFCFKFKFDRHIKKIETNKRNYCIYKLKENKCTHHLVCDVDELYKKNEFNACKKIIKDNNYDSSYCCSYTYFKKPTWQINKLAMWVPFICKINTTYKTGSTRGIKNKITTQTNIRDIKIDKSRKLLGKKIKIFKPSEIVMHHMSRVRESYNSYSEKLFNKAHNVIKNSNSTERIRNRINAIQKESSRPDMIEVSNYFNIPFSLK